MQHIFKSESLVNIRLTQIHEEVENLVENKKSVEPEKTKRVKTGKSSEGKENSGSRISRTNKKSLFFPQSSLDKGQLTQFTQKYGQL